MTQNALEARYICSFSVFWCYKIYDDNSSKFKWVNNIPTYVVKITITVTNINKLTLLQPSCFDHRIQGALLQPPWIVVFQSEFSCEIILRYVFGVKESNGDSSQFSIAYHVTLKLKIIDLVHGCEATPCMMTFTFKVTEWLRSIYS